MIAQESIDEVRQRAKIEEVVGEYVELKNRGSSLLGLCPFHAEKSPSFSVNSNRGFYHCFGCGESGNAFTFLMKTQGVSFPDAVQLLADRYGVELKRTNVSRSKKPKVDTRLYYRLNELAFEFFKTSFRTGPTEVKNYVTSRGIQETTLNAFGIGFSPPEWRALTTFLRQRNVPDELLVSSGLCRRSSRGDLYDTFRGRLIFPVFESQSRILGFGGRTVPALEASDSNAPKYINSPESPIYHKSKVLYGLPTARTAMREDKHAYLVEGYLDVIGLWQSGVKSAVATCGTSVTRQHVERLSQFAQKVTVIFDGDTAGRAAAGKCFELFLNTGVDGDALFLDDGEDPDTFAKMHGEATPTVLQQSKKKSLLSCYMLHVSEKLGSSQIGTLGAAAKGELASKVINALRGVENPIEQSELIKEAAFELNTDVETLSSQLQTGGRDATSRESVPAVVEQEPGEILSAGAPNISTLPAIDRSVLRCAMVNKDKVPGAVLSDPGFCFSLQDWTLTFIEGLKAAVGSSSSADQSKTRTRDLLESFGASWLQYWVESYQMVQDKEVDLSKTFQECQAAILRERLDSTLLKIDETIRQCEDADEKAELFQEKLELQRQRQAMVSQGT